MPKVVLTGGGTAGHVTPNLALLPELYKRGFEVFYIGSKNGMEVDLVRETGLPYFSVSAGKLRRYFDIKNISDTGRILKGFLQSIKILKKIKPDVVFSKGGFVTSPVVWASWLLKIPIVLHESDITPGLANKLSLPFAGIVCVSFPETKECLSGKNTVVTGIPIRQELFGGDAATGRKLCGFTDRRPVMMIIGGSQGSQTINGVIRKGLQAFLNSFQVCHICGKGGIDENLSKLSGYRQFEYVKAELPHLFAMSDIIISRAGATTLFEIVALKKLNILVPLGKKASRGDQILNAKSFEKHGLSKVITEEDLTVDSLIAACREVLENKDLYYENMKKTEYSDSTAKIADIIQCVIEQK
ncbi:MAG TPA: undecaprenyldiphospho-muramoylpentapeptide beta-N-acetylglucosaminyltransferase [Clostridiaceae bacterium]|jgi:UDP-N-acetylglucosamine--N-acetylmuramyl-(pentapeptide) pyrophosphoryl-undecaprenol N-acetylglucosamine transferase|nr:undecaprenyldiphospho-muramoylpentapeptide beta-N-acetylglucosaminyltransferase [Clostridiaceae bacterium]